MERKILKKDDAQFQRLENFKNADADKQRFLVHSNKLSSIDTVVKYETEEKLCYFTETLTPKMGLKGYIQRTAKEGVTFNKLTRKLIIWYGKKPMSMHGKFIPVMMNDQKMDWFLMMPSSLQVVATRMLWEKMFKGLITNAHEYTTSYLKYHLKIKDINPTDYFTVVAGYQVSTVSKFNSILRCAKNPQAVVENYSLLQPNLETWSSQHLVNNARILDQKIDWTLNKEQLNYVNKEMEEKLIGLSKEYALVEEFYSYEKKPHENPARAIWSNDEHIPF